MTLVATYRAARDDEAVARLRRVISVRAMVATGMSQRKVAEELGVTQPAVSQQLSNAPDLTPIPAGDLMKAAAPVLKVLAEDHDYRRLAVFGSVARDEAGEHSDIDLIVEPPSATSSFEFVRFKRLVEQVLGREIDLISYGGLTADLDDDVRRDAVLL